MGKNKDKIRVSFKDSNAAEDVTSTTYLKERLVRL